MRTATAGAQSNKDIHHMHMLQSAPVSTHHHTAVSAHIPRSCITSVAWWQSADPAAFTRRCNPKVFCIHTHTQTENEHTHGVYPRELVRHLVERSVGCSEAFHHVRHGGVGRAQRVATTGTEYL